MKETCLAGNCRIVAAMRRERNCKAVAIGGVMSERGVRGG